MQNLEPHLDRAEYWMQLARQHPRKLKTPTNETSKWKSIHQKLMDIFIDESTKEGPVKQLYRSSHLLDKLLAKEKLNCLIINLYPGNEGYSLMVKNSSGVETETMHLPYEESEFLQCINNEELPPILVDLLDRSQANIFYSGCIIVEIRDYRRSSNSTVYERRHVLLNPTTQTLLCDVNLITSDSNKWTQDDKQHLESLLLLATQEPLCLNPSASVAILANRLQYQKNKFNTTTMHRTVKKFSQAAVNRKRKFESCAAPPGLHLYDYLAKQKDSSMNTTLVSLKSGKPLIDKWKEYPIPLVPPENMEVLKQVKAMERPKTPQNNTPELVEEYTFETEPNQGKITYTHLTIYRYPIEDMFLGELYIDRDYTEGQRKGKTYSFSYRLREDVDKYIKQFTEIVTEEGRKSVKITYQAPGQPPKIINVHDPSTLLAVMPTTLVPSSSPGPMPKSFAGNRTAASSAAMRSPQLHTSSPAATSTHTSSSRSSNRQTAAIHPAPQSSSVSPAHCSVTSPGPLPSYTQAVTQSKSNPTPPPNARTPTPNSTLAPTPPPQTSMAGPRIPQSAENLLTSTANASANSVSQLGLLSGVPLGLASIITGGGDPTTGLASSMSLTGMPMPSGIAVPISLAMMHSTQSHLNTHAPSSVIVSSIPGLLSASGLSNTASQAANSATLTTTVTTASGVGTPAVIVTSGMLTSPPPVLATPTSMLPLSIGMQGNLNQLMASGLKGNTQGIRAATGSPLSLLQVSGAQQTLSLFSQLHRATQPGQVRATSGQQHTIAPSPPTQSGSISSAAGSVTAPLLTTILPQQPAILAYQKQPTQQPSTQIWSQSSSVAQPSKCKSRKRSTPSPRDQQGGTRARDSSKSK